MMHSIYKDVVNEFDTHEFNDDRFHEWGRYDLFTYYDNETYGWGYCLAVKGEVLTYGWGCLSRHDAIVTAKMVAQELDEER